MHFPWFFTSSTNLGSSVAATNLPEQAQVSRPEAALQLMLQPGQIIEGKVVQLLPHNTAWIQIGHFKVLAQINVSLKHGQQEWFQVARAAQPIILKVLSIPDRREIGQSSDIDQKWTTLFRWLQAEDTPLNRQIVQQIMNRQIPLTSALFKQIEQALAQTAGGEKEVLAALWAVQKGWPPSPSVIRSLVTYWEAPELPQLLADLKQSLPPERSVNWQLFLNNLPIKDLTAHHIRQYFHQLHFNLHQNDANSTTAEQVNLPQLVQILLKENVLSNRVADKAEQLLYYLAGQQLMMKGETPGSPLVYSFFQLLIQHHGQQQTVYGKLDGYTSHKGKLDTDHCRILLYARPQHLNELCIDILIQKKLITLKLYNNALSQEWLDHYKPILAKNLASRGYQLGSLLVKKWDTLGEAVSQQHKLSSKPIPYQGVDIRL